MISFFRNVCCLMVMTFLMLAAVAQASEQPKLIVQITVDALRGDFPYRFQHMLGKGGFRYLMKGVNYTNAAYQHANTETIVGHTSLATGALPSDHGMVANVWFDRELGRLVYNIEDPAYHLLSVGADVNQSSEIDHTQKIAKVDGRSPNNILSSTFSDELAIHYGGKAKIFAVSIKDRGAVSMAGHAGKAFWFSKASGDFVTSSYYYKQYPTWVNAWNAKKLVNRYAGKSWDLMVKENRYMFEGADDRAYETALPGFGHTFPHEYGQADGKYFTSFLTLSPAGDEITLDFAKQLIKEERLGEDNIPDYLAISFSSTDYVGHMFGASSLESEDNMARLDRTLADLLHYIDEKVGLKSTLIVLSADHGQPEAPGYLHSLHMQKAHYFDPKKMDKAPAIERLKKRFHIHQPLITKYFHPYVYLDHALITKRGLNISAVEAAVAVELVKFKGVAYAISRSQLETGSFPDSKVARSILSNFHAKRSGDIYVVFEPNVFINDFNHLTVASAHGSPWHYDTFVPVMFAGFGLRSNEVSRAMAPYDIATTLAAMIHANPPSASTGAVLPEVVNHF